MESNNKSMGKGGGMYVSLYLSIYLIVNINGISFFSVTQIFFKLIIIDFLFNFLC